MAPKKKAKRNAPKPQGSDKKGGAEGLVHGLLTVLLSIIIVVAVFGGAFYYVLKNNIYGIGEQFRPRLANIPVLKLALPPLPEEEDPEDPKYLTQWELIENYNALRAGRQDLTARLEEANSRIAELEAEKGQWTALKEEAEGQKHQNEETLKQIEEQTAKLKQDEKELSRLIAEGNPEGFKAYFERIDPETARELYQELLIEETVNQELKNLAKTYETMDAAHAANILTELGSKDMPLMLDLMDVMKTANAADIIENMEPGFASDLLRDLADKKLKETRNP